MGNSDSVMVQKRMARFRPEERTTIDGVFDRLLGGSRAEKTLQLETLQTSMGDLASDTMVKRIYRCMCSIDPGQAAPSASAKEGTAGVDREQLIVFLADTLRGTAEERAPLVLVMSHNAEGVPDVVTCEQVAAFLEDLISAIVQILTKRGRLQGWKPEQMGDTQLGIKLLAEQMCSELKASDQGTCDVSCLEDWIFRVSQVSLYLEILVAEGLNVSLGSWTAPTLLPLCKETHWKDLKCLLDIPTLMFLAPQLPDSYSTPWRLVFSTHLHGESFTKMVSGLTHHGPTVLLIKDTKGHVFGGFASQAWEMKPQFQGWSPLNRNTFCCPTAEGIQMKTYRNQGRQNFLNFKNKRLRHCLYSLRSYKSRHGLWLHGFHGDIELEDSVYYNLMYGKVKAVSDNLLSLEEMLPRGKWKTLFLISVFFFFTNPLLLP
ncbi:MTOR-associated protein MEAK7 isoform X2 [Cyprinodon tularosa]|uniref:MTOR-associated protein MEAK7 isoform X2 n=1 Tax=Cyprinodon tularosa TaxID=77115 RepID=UPI0018E1EE01|nr:MTOR-associated protein MEAK7 isoform X2 [Cyprinodon tularosa]